MKLFKKAILLLLLSGLVLPEAFAQNTSTQGKEFWLSFMHNGYKDHTLGGWVINQVLISAKRDCSGTVTNPLTGWEETFSVRANNITTIEIPQQQGYHDGNTYETIAQKGIKVAATDTISVFCTNIAYVSFDASFVLPTESLGDEYVIQSYDQSRSGSNTYVSNNETSAFLIVATEDNTEIEITPTAPTLGGHQSGQTFTVTMNAGETYQVRSARTGTDRDLSGTHVLASDCKRIAVFNGNTLTCIPTTMDNGYDQVFEQAMPLRSWGKNFVVTSSRNRNRDFIKITSSANGNDITKNGEPLVSLRAGQSYTFDMNESEGSCFIQATQPSAVYLFNNSSYDQSWLGGLGDPSMVWIAPVEQRIDEVTFTTFDHVNINIEVHCVNIIVNTEDVSHVYFDDQQISPLSFNRVNGNNNYSYTRMDISHGVHHIACENGFNAHVYGFGDAKGYAYLVGSNAIDLSTNLTLNNEVMQANESFPYCIEEPVVFSVEVNFPEYNLLWDFGDGTTSTENPVTHIYHDKRIYQVALAVTTDASGCTSSDSDTTKFYVDTQQQYITESDEICSGEYYSGHGFNNVLIQNDTILARLQDNPLHSVCKDSLLVYITARPAYHIPINDSRCWQGAPAIYDDHGFSFEYNQPGEYDRQLNLESVNGCDSILMLHLTVADQVTYEFDHHECSSSYVWDGETYTNPGTYEKYYTTAGGCDSIVTLHLTMGLPQHVTFDTITCGTFVWNGVEYTNSGIYQQVFTTYNGCDSIVDCNLITSGSVEGTTLSVSECNSYTWLGTEYTLSGNYDQILPTALGCDSTVHLNLSLNYTPNPTDIYPKDPDNTAPHWVVTATEFQINSYEFYFWDYNPHCQWESIVWSFENPNLNWVLEPDTTTYPVGRSCKMYVLGQVEDTVWLNAKVYNACGQQGVERRYWFVCSFYGLDESGHADFSVLPNPNNGQMTLNFEHLTGKVDIKVYDMRGTLIDAFQTFNDNESSTYYYEMKSRAGGLYYFVATSKEGTVAKKVVVFH